MSPRAGHADAAGPSPWIISPTFDLLFIANLGWLVCLLPGMVDPSGVSHLEFWQIYFITTPHRWMTLLLVSTDPERRGNRTWFFLLLAIVSAAVVGGVYAWTQGFYCLLVVDYLWNSWHFGAQHGGILRIYSRRGGGGNPLWETWSLRAFVVYVFVRMAGWSTGWTETVAGAPSVLMITDFAFLALPLLLLGAELLRNPLKRPGKVVYLASVTAVYSLILLSSRHGYTTLVIGLTVGIAMFHATEYLAIVTFYARRRKSTGAPAPFQTMAKNWMLVLFSFVLVLGLIASTVNMYPRLVNLWLGLNLWAAYLHYAYDGMIWKLRQASTAKVLQVELETARASS